MSGHVSPAGQAQQQRRAFGGYYQGALCKNPYTITVLAAMHARRTIVVAMMAAIATPLPRFRGACTWPGSEFSSLIGSLHSHSVFVLPLAHRYCPSKALVGRAGLEPAKAEPTDLQSVPFAARDTDPS
jgi:hypothetical protein